MSVNLHIFLIKKKYKIGVYYVYETVKKIKTLA